MNDALLCPSRSADVRGSMPEAIAAMLRDDVAKIQPLVQLTHENRATVRGDARPLELDLQRCVVQELKGLVRGLTH